MSDLNARMKLAAFLANWMRGEGLYVDDEGYAVFDEGAENGFSTSRLADDLLDRLEPS